MAEITDDAVWMPPDVAPLVGKEAVRSFYQGLFAQVELEGHLSPENQELHIFGDWAVFRGVVVGSVRPRGGGEPAVLSNKVVNVLRRDADGSWKHVWDIRRDADGSWKHVWDIWNSMPPPETTP
jgi:ketosteroid isomerase-like protein